MSLFDTYSGKEGDTFEAGWRNKLIWGDNLPVMGSLLEKFAVGRERAVGDRGEGLSRHMGRGGVVVSLNALPAAGLDGRVAGTFGSNLHPP